MVDPARVAQLAAGLQPALLGPQLELELELGLETTGHATTKPRTSVKRRLFERQEDVRTVSSKLAALVGHPVVLATEGPRSRSRSKPVPFDEGNRKRGAAKCSRRTSKERNVLRPAPVLSSVYSMVEYREYVQWLNEKNAGDEDVIAKRELRRLVKSKGQASPLWSTMSEFVGMTRATTR